MPVASQDALTGLGVPAQLADLMGAQASTIAGKGTTQTGATVILSKSSELTTASGQTAFILKSGSGINEPWCVVNSASTAAVVYPPVGDYMNGSQNASFSVAQWKPTTFIQYKPHYWAAQLSA